MGKVRIGNKLNAALNGEWGFHVRRATKKWTAARRRKRQLKTTVKELDELYN